jgi:phosphate/sulfate permease
MNKETLTQTSSEEERKAVDAVFNIMLVFTALLLAFCLGYYVASMEAAALVKTILN